MVGLGVRYDILEKERIGGVNRNWSMEIQNVWSGSDRQFWQRQGMNFIWGCGFWMWR